MHLNECWQRRSSYFFSLVVLLNIWLWPHVISGRHVPLTARGCKASCDHCPGWLSAVSWPPWGGRNFLILRITAKVVKLKAGGHPLALTYPASPSNTFKTPNSVLSSFLFEISTVVSDLLIKHWLPIDLVIVTINLWNTSRMPGLY